MDHDVKRFNGSALAYFPVERLRDIHSAALDVLNDCGTVVHHSPSLELLRGAGVYVCRTGKSR